MEAGQIGRRVRAFRKLKRMQQTELAKEIGLSTTVLGRIERGEKVPQEETLAKIAQALQIHIEELSGE
ncbi:MAG: helix-turn-helix transcriptional regulator [Lysinibacillus sp.]